VVNIRLIRGGLLRLSLDAGNIAPASVYDCVGGSIAKSSHTGTWSDGFSQLRT
jgi:hypothetical protein